MTWAFFNATSQRDQSICERGEIVSLRFPFIKISLGFGEGSNNYVELLSCKYLTLFPLEKGYQNVQIFGDSMLVND